jgi:ring-1,2-phenylacetyl-CoA epoxidase subunit PaaB
VSMAEEVFEVFAQPARGEPFRHVGSLLAADRDMALLLAKENFGRRGGVTALWVVARAAIAAAPEGTFGPVVPRLYREGEGYRATVEKRSRLKERIARGA